MKDKRAINWIKGNFIGYRLLYAVLIAVSVLKGALTVFLAVAVKWTINAAERGSADLWKYAVVLCATAALEVISQMVMRLLQGKVRFGVEVRIKNRIFSSALGKDYAAISEYHSGDILNRISSDSAVVANGATGFVPSLALMVTRLVGALGVMAWLLPYFTLILAGCGIVVTLFALLFRKKMKTLHKSAQEADGKARSYMQEAVENRLAVKVFAAEEAVSQKSATLTGDYSRKKYRNEKYAVTAESAFNLFFGLAYAAALVWGAFSIKSGVMDYGTLAALLQLVSQVQVPIIRLSAFLPTYFAMLASAERLIEIEDITGAPKLPPIADVNGFYRGFVRAEFDGVAFSYGRDTVFEDASFTVEKGEFVVIKGISGIGKSTLLKLMLGVYDCGKGCIKFVTENGELTPAEVRGVFAYVPQGNMLFSGTVKENVLFVKPDATDEEIASALKISRADEFIGELPEGLNTVVGENGYGLSEGQIQRIAVARALVSGAPILLLDEATSALDAATEEKMLSGLKAERDKTVVLVTHKTAAVALADKIIEIDGKKVVVNVRS